MATHVGFRCGCNIFVTRPASTNFNEFEWKIQALPFDEMSVEIEHYEPTPRGKVYEQFRPTLAEIAPLVGRLLRLTRLHKDQWRRVEHLTETARRARAIEQSDDYRWTSSESDVAAVCELDLAIYGKAGRHGRAFGPASERTVGALIDRVLEGRGGRAGTRSTSRVLSRWIIGVFARQWGDVDGVRVHLDAPSVRNLWLHRAAMRR